MKKGIAIIIFFALILAALSLSLSAKLASRIAGVVVDKETGEPVSGANIYIRQRDRNSKCLTYQSSFDLTTDDFGRFSQLLDQIGAYKVYCQIEGYVTFKPDSYSSLNGEGDFTNDKVFDVSEGEVKFLRIELERGGTLQGTFKLKTGKRISTAPFEISLYQKIPQKNGKQEYRPTVISVETDGSGFFKINDLKAGRDYFAYVSPGDGFPRTTIENISIHKNSATDISTTFLLPLDTGVQGRVMIKTKRKYYGNVYLKMEPKQTEQTGEAQGFYEGVQMVDRETGEYCIRGLQPGFYRIISLVNIGPEKWEKIEDTVEIKSGAIVTKNIHLP